MKWKRTCGCSARKSLDILGLMCREIVEHDVDLLRPRGLRATKSFQKRDELFAGMAARSHALHLASLHIQRRIQRQRAVAIIFKAMPFGAPRR